MPFLAAIPLATLLTAAGTAGTLAETGYQLSNQPGNPSKALEQQEQQQQKQQAAQQSLNKQEAVLSSTGQAQAQTGGSLTDSSFDSFRNMLAGFPGAGGTTASASKTAPQSVADILAVLNGSNSNISGGGGNLTPPPPQQFFELAAPMVG